MSQATIETRSKADYERLCGFRSESTLALTYPHVLAFGLQMAVMSDRAFPLSLLGLIHTRNRIRRYRLIAADELLRFSVAVSSWRDLTTGCEFDLDTHCFTSRNELVWSERSTMRAPNRGTGRGRRSEGVPPEFAFASWGEWSLPANLGRRYARVAGDYNPIHLGRLPARVFGFKQAIATGMWLQARAAAALDSLFEREAVAIDITFKKPVPLPATREFVVGNRQNGQLSFGLIDHTSGALHVRGTVHELKQNAPDYDEE